MRSLHKGTPSSFSSKSFFVRAEVAHVRQGLVQKLGALPVAVTWIADARAASKERVGMDYTKLVQGSPQCCRAVIWKQN